MTMHLQRDLEDLKKKLLDMGSLVEKATNLAISALQERRADLCSEVHELDVTIDRREVVIEEDCLKILALHQPVATDLRFVVCVMKVNNDLERMGDLAINIAERAAYLATHDDIGVPLDFHRMLEVVRTMVKQSLNSLINLDVMTAREVLAMDDEVDDINKQMFVILEALMFENPAVITRAIHMLSASRHLERIADLATNIAEDVAFLVEGAVIRHQPEDYTKDS
ncbi:MAG: phosphate signaling complex protein PhoU [Planctomycetia bacterium]|nr:phosphate signaling complex protein PhoU [Planctomycetia bacterium]MBL6914419.1 phosphate signaling complex protein PhoU [Planctomycetota bacterium]